MERSKFSEEQVIAILREQKAGAKTADVCRKRGIGNASFHAWKAKFEGMLVSDAHRRKAPEAENATPMRLYAEVMLDNAGLKDLSSPKW